MACEACQRVIIGIMPQYVVCKNVLRLAGKFFDSSGVE
ncbi:nucleocapsid protein [Escherichia coli]|nr:nucleocapsid protein [Escherichia coli]